MKKMLAMLSCALIAAPAIADGPLLCSEVQVAVSYAQYTCIFPGSTFNVEVKFTVGLKSWQPYFNSPWVYGDSSTVNKDGTGICGWPYSISGDALPPGLYELQLNGSGTNYATYTHRWQGRVGHWGYPSFINPLVAVIVSWDFTDPKSWPAKGCCS